MKNVNIGDIYLPNGGNIQIGDNISYNANPRKVYIEDIQPIADDVRTSVPSPDLTRLEEYMSVQYRRSDNYRRLLDYLDAELHNPACCPKDWARYALVIYNSGAMHNLQKPKTFAKWHETFCSIVGCEYIEYKPSQLNLDAHTQAIAAYFS